MSQQFVMVFEKTVKQVFNEIKSSENNKEVCYHI